MLELLTSAAQLERTETRAAAPQQVSGAAHLATVVALRGGCDLGYALLLLRFEAIDQPAATLCINC